MKNIIVWYQVFGEAGSIRLLIFFLSEFLLKFLNTIYQRKYSHELFRK